ncbi:MAG: prepilin-type N-terminal cleavage/methylation domain-containing protein [Methylophilaceae bacterium]|nr:prepilin-type N-terminal cleavage/methylation domain-containing protein [Methylophilaceae bacterium]
MTSQNLKGFTLIEMAIVLVIVGLILGGLLLPLSVQVDQKKYNETHQALGEIREAIMGFSLSHSALDGKPYLPCPDTDANGMENRTGAICTSPEGDLPWADLGMPRLDGWDRTYRYRVTPAYSSNAVGFTLTSLGVIDVLDAVAGNVIASNLPLVVFSRGKNGVSGSVDEAENSDNDTVFVSHPPSEVAGSEFDDALVWVPSVLLFNRMVTASRLP